MDTHGERLARIEANTETLIKRFDKIDVRVSSVEKKQWYHTGLMALVGAYVAKFGFVLPH